MTRPSTIPRTTHDFSNPDRRQQAKQPQIDGAKDTEGLSKSSMNALKHGMRSKKQALLLEDSFAFENRLRKWVSIADPDDDVGEFLVHQYVSQSFELERVERAHLERLTSLIENSDETELDAVHELGKRLFFDPTGPTPLYGNRPDGRIKLKTSWNGQAVDPNDPAVLVRKLESSEAGCLWVRERWEELRQLEPGRFWQSPDRLKAIRLLGRQPLDAVEDRRIAEIFVASHALNPVGDSPFDDLLSDMERRRSSATGRQSAQWPDLVSAKDKARCRQVLIDLADRNIERLNAKLEVHEQNADANAERTFTRLGFDQSRDGERIRAYHMKCLNGFYRGIETYRKYQGNKRAEGRERRIEDEPRRVEDGERRIGDFARWTADGGRRNEDGGLSAEDRGRTIGDEGRWGDEMDPSHHVPDRVFSHHPPPATRHEEMDASDRLPDRSFVVGDGDREALEPSIDSDALSDRGVTVLRHRHGQCHPISQRQHDGRYHPLDGVTLSDGTTPRPASPFRPVSPCWRPRSSMRVPATRGETHAT